MATTVQSGAPGPFVFPTHLTFPSPKARPKIVLVGQDVYLQGGECSGENVITLSGPKKGPQFFFVFEVAPHARGWCTVVFYKKKFS